MRIYPENLGHLKMGAQSTATTIQSFANKGISRDAGLSASDVALLEHEADEEHLDINSEREAPNLV